MEERVLIEAVENAQDSEHLSEADERVGPLELFFDLVFVFAITQVTAYIAKDPHWETLFRGLMILAVVWWAWVAYSWLTNTLDTERDDVRIVMFVAMAAMFVVSLSIPHAFNDEDDIDRFLACCDAFAPASVGHASRE